MCRKQHGSALCFTAGHDFVVSSRGTSAQHIALTKSDGARFHRLTTDFDREVNKQTKTKAALGTGFAEIGA